MTDLDIREVPGGVVIEVSVKPKGKRDAIEGIHAGALKISVTAAPEKGRANAAVIAVLAKFFGIAKNRIAQETGEKSKQKSFLIEGLTREEIIDRLVKEGVT